MKKVLTTLSVLLCFMLLFSSCGLSSDDLQTIKDMGESVREQLSSDKPEFEKGESTEKSYKSKFLGVSFVAPEGFYMATEEQIKEIAAEPNDFNNLTQDELDAANAVIEYEMMSFSSTTGSSVIVACEKKALPIITEDIYLDSVQQQLKDSRIQTGEKSKVTIAGREYKCITAKVAMNAQVMLNQVYCVRVIGDYSALITFSYADGQDAEYDLLLNTFKPIAE